MVNYQFSMIVKSKKVNMLGVTGDNHVARDITRGIASKSIYKHLNMRQLKVLWKQRREINAVKNYKRMQTLEHYLTKKNLPLTYEGYVELISKQQNGPKKLFNHKAKKAFKAKFEKYKFKTVTEAKNFYAKFVNLPRFQKY